MAIITTTLESSLQSKLDATTGDTENKEFLILGKAMQSIVGVIAVGEVIDEAVTQTALVLAEGTTQVIRVIAEGDTQEERVSDEGDLQVSNVQAIASNLSSTNVAETRSASIDMDDNLLLQPELRDYTETVQAMAADDVDCTAASVHTKSISVDTTLTFSNPPTAGKCASFTLILELTAFPTITWPTSVMWAYSGTLPETSATGTDIFTFMTTDGGTIWYGFLAGKGMG